MQNCKQLEMDQISVSLLSYEKKNKNATSGSNISVNTALFFRYTGVNATNAANILAKRR